MDKDINRSVINLRDSYFSLDNEVQEKLNMFIENLQHGNLTSSKIQNLFKQNTGIDLVQDSIKYAMLLNNYIPKDMHAQDWEFSI